MNYYLGSITGAETLTLPTNRERIRLDIYVFHPSYPTYTDNLGSIYITKDELSAISAENWMLRAYWAVSGTLSDNRVVSLIYKKSTSVLSISECNIASGANNKNNCKVFAYAD